MDEIINFFQVVEEVCDKDPRYKPDAYEFLMLALNFTQKKLKRQGHVSGRELVEGMRDFAIEQYGALAKTVLGHWGITKTRDFGNMVFNLIDRKMLGKTETDSIEDFSDVYDFEAAFANVIENTIKDIQ